MHSPTGICPRPWPNLLWNFFLPVFNHNFSCCSLCWLSPLFSVCTSKRSIAVGFLTLPIRSLVEGHSFLNAISSPGWTGPSLSASPPMSHAHVLLTQTKTIYSCSKGRTCIKLMCESISLWCEHKANIKKVLNIWTKAEQKEKNGFSVFILVKDPDHCHYSPAAVGNPSVGSSLIFKLLLTIFYTICWQFVC